MAPEQLLNPGRIGVQADIWALGLIPCELATGRLPFETWKPLWWLAQPRPPLRIFALRPGLTAGLDIVLERCLSPDPSARYRSVEEFSEALAATAPDDCPRSTERISKITNAVLESQRPVALAQNHYWVPPAPS